MKGVKAADLQGAHCMSAALCDDCPPLGYPTDKTRCLECPRRTPPKLDAMADKVLAYRPKPKSEAAKSRKRKAAKVARKLSKTSAILNIIRTALIAAVA